MKRKLRSTALASAGALAIAAGVSVFAAGPANAAVSGSVTCDTYSSTYKVVGVWIDSTNNAHDGFASWSPYAGAPWTASYSKGNIAAGESYKVHVGCGGTTSSWGQTAYSPFVTGGHDFICHVTSAPAQRVCSS